MALKACPQAESRRTPARPAAASFMIERGTEGAGVATAEGVGWVNNAREREGECQVDIVDGDNAAEIAGEQRGLMMTLLASERASEQAN